MHMRQVFLFGAAVLAAAGCGGAATRLPTVQTKPASRPVLPSKPVPREFSGDDKDHDGDGIPDTYDLCVDAAEDGKGFHPWDGCPDQLDPSPRGAAGTPAAGPAALGSDRITISEEILFAEDSPAIDAKSTHVVAAVAEVLDAHPEVDFVEVAGHANVHGTEARNRTLTQMRAEAVLKELVADGVAKKRLRAVGYSSYCPLDASNTDAALAKNRRVEFVILRREGKTLGAPWGDCEAAKNQGMKPAPLPPSATTVVPAKAARPAAAGAASVVPSVAPPRGGALSASPDVAMFEKYCALGYGTHCHLAGAYYKDLFEKENAKDPNTAGADLMRASALFKRGCALGVGMSCEQVNYAATMRTPSTHGLEQDDAVSMALRLRACEHGDVALCVGAPPYELATALAHTQEQESFRVACAGGPTVVADACMEYLRLAESKIAGTTFDGAIVGRTLIEGCRAGSEKACEVALHDLKKHPGVTFDRAELVDALHLYCVQVSGGRSADEAGASYKATGAYNDREARAKSCQALGELPDPWQPLRVCKSGDWVSCIAACYDKGDAEGCLGATLAIAYGVGALRYAQGRSQPSVQRLLAEVSARGDSRAKLIAAVILEGEDDHWSAPKLEPLKALCTDTETIGCGNLGRVYWDGRLTAPDDASAIAAFKKGCDGGDPIACAYLGRVGGDATATAKACSGGFKPACAK